MIMGGLGFLKWMKGITYLELNSMDSAGSDSIGSDYSNADGLNDANI